MKKTWPVIDTSFAIGVGALTHFIAEEEMETHLTNHKIDIQYVYQPDESFVHRTPDWNPYLGNDYIAKIQKLFDGRVRGLATLQGFHQPPNCHCGETVCPYGFDKTKNIAMEELDRVILDLGLWGIRINPSAHNYPLNSRGFVWPFLRRLSQLQEKTGRRMIVSVYSYGDHIFNTTESFMESAKEFPSLLFLMQHTGFVWGCFTLGDTVSMMQNVYFDVTTMPQFDVVWPVYKRFGVRKICIGIDGPLGDVRVKEAIAADYCKTEEEKELMYGGNLAQALGIPPLV